MAKIEATNNYVHVERDELQSESNGLIIPDSGRVKPHTGKIISVGGLVRDARIKNGKGKKALWHKTVGQEIEYEGEIILVLEDIHVIGVV